MEIVGRINGQAGEEEAPEFQVSLLLTVQVSPHRCSACIDFAVARHIVLPDHVENTGRING